MYPVSEAFLRAVQENTRHYYRTGRIVTAAGKKIAVRGFMLHSVGCPQPEAAVFVNGWNSAGCGHACVHGFIDGNDGAVWQTLPWDHRGWLWEGVWKMREKFRPVLGGFIV